MPLSYSVAGRIDLCYTTADFFAGCPGGRPEKGSRKHPCMAAQQGERERGHVSDSASISAGIAARYATAVFELAKDGNELEQLEQDIDALEATLADSADFRSLIHSPIYSREAQGKAIAAIAEKMGVSDTVANTLKLMASKRRLFVLPQVAAALRNLIAEEKGEVTADVRAAAALSDDQRNALAATLKKSVGKDVKMNVTVDEGLIGGLVVKVGSRMIDTSVRSKLAALQNTMKEVG